MESRREQALVTGLVLGGLMLRLIAAVAFPVTPVSDSHAYHDLAVSMADGHGFTLTGQPETVWAPAYPAIVAAVYSVAGKSFVAVYVVQAFIDIGACLLLWWWTRRRAGASVALVALALSVVSISAIASVRLERTESLAAWLIVAAMALVDLARGSRREALLYAAGGAVLGILTLSRWQFSLFPLFVGAALVFDRKWRAAALLLGVYTLTLSPWLVRNYRAIGAPVLSTQTGTTFYMSHFRNPGQPWGVNTYDETTIAATKLEPLAANKFLVSETLRRLAAHPSIVVRKYPEKLFYLMVPFDWEVLGVERHFNPTYFFILLLALAGVGPLFSEDRRWFVALTLPLAYLIVMTLPFYGSPRFRLPVEPLLAPLAAMGLLRLWRGMIARRSPDGVATG